MANAESKDDATKCAKFGCKNFAFVGTLCTYHFNREMRGGK